MIASNAIFSATVGALLKRVCANSTCHSSCITKRKRCSSCWQYFSTKLGFNKSLLVAPVVTAAVGTSVVSRISTKRRNASSSKVPPGMQEARRSSNVRGRSRVAVVIVGFPSEWFERFERDVGRRSPSDGVRHRVPEEGGTGCGEIRRGCDGRR